MNIRELAQARRDDILRVASKHGARNVRVFGSAARGESLATSDLDLLVDVGPTHSPWFPAGLRLELQDLLGCEVDIVTEQALHWYIRDGVLAEAVPL